MPQPALIFSHEAIRSVVVPGDVVVDATAGNGHDTVFLAELVGVRGRVFAVDAEPEATARTERRAEGGGFGDRVRVIEGRHEDLKSHVPGEHHGQIKAVMFNLGYLPGKMPRVPTRPDTTVEAVKASLALICEGGVVTVVLYGGHPGGQLETALLEAWSARLPPEVYTVLSYHFLNQRNDPPRCLVIEKRIRNR